MNVPVDNKVHNSPGAFISNTAILEVRKRTSAIKNQKLRIESECREEISNPSIDRFLDQNESDLVDG